MPELLANMIKAAVTLLVTWLCGLLHLSPNPADLGTLSAWISAGITLLVSAGLIHYGPILLSWLKKTPPPAALLSLALLCAGITAVMTTSGCSLFAPPTVLTPQDQAIQQVSQAEEAYLLLTMPVDIAIARGDIKGTAAVAINTAEKIAVSYLDAARTAAKAGTTVDVDKQLELFRQAKADVITAISALPKAPATAPAIPSTSQPAPE